MDEYQAVEAAEKLATSAMDYMPIPVWRAMVNEIAAALQSNLSASVPEQSDDYRRGVEDAISVVVQSCSCGSGPEFRPVSQRHHQIHCSTLVAPMIRALLGGQAPEQSPRVCVKCGGVIANCECVGICSHCKCPASVPRVEFHACDYDYSNDGKCVICGLPEPASVPDAGEWIDEYQTAIKIAIYLSQNFYHEQSWVPEPTLIAVLTQIDNMVAGLTPDAGVEAMRQACIKAIEKSQSDYKGSKNQDYDYGLSDGMDRAITALQSLTPASQGERDANS